VVYAVSAYKRRFTLTVTEIRQVFLLYTGNNYGLVDVVFHEVRNAPSTNTS